jgi:hypothetical protein
MVEPILILILLLHGSVIQTQIVEDVFLVVVAVRV